MITSDGVAKIVDFGLAKLARGTKLTKTGMTLGTVAYMSPEQTKGTEVDHQADIWALGVVLYEMVTRQQPFKADYEQAVVYSILNQEPEPVTGLRIGVPMELERIITKAIAKIPSQRYQNIDEMGIDLRSVIKTPVDVKSVNAQQAKQRRIRSYILGSLALIFILLLANALYLLLPSKSGSVETKSIAVMPFENLNRIEGDEYFSDGIT